MFTITQDSLQFNDNQLPDFVASVNNHLYGKRIILNEQIANGDYKILEFPNGLTAYVSNYILHEDFSMELALSKPGYTALHINLIQAGASFSMLLNNHEVSYDDRIISSIFMTGDRDSLVLRGSSGACVNRIKLMIPEKWLQANLQAYSKATLDSYFALQEDRFFFDAVDSTYRSMIDKIMNTEDDPHYLPDIQHVAAMIAERFYNRVDAKMQTRSMGSETRP